eukprot:COSAG02_NODE_11424_length_1727_cov_0.836609_1_plen_117_part_00
MQLAGSLRKSYSASVRPFLSALCNAIQVILACLLLKGMRETGDTHAAKHAAQAVMRRCCAATGLGDEEFVQRHTHETPRGHSQMIMRAEWVDAAGRSIDELHGSFVTNCEIKQVCI